MSNPARELATILEGWRTLSGGSVHKQRGTRTDEGWVAQVHAVELLAEVQRYLVALRDSGTRVDHYERWMSAWVGAVFLPDRQWGASGNAAGEHLFEQSVVDMLNALADKIDATQLSVQLSEDVVQSSIAALDEIVADLQAVELTPAARQYVFELINSCRTVFQESSAIGSVDLLRRVHELLGVITMLAESLQADPETANIGKKILKTVRRVVPYAAFGVRVTAGTLAAGADLMQITSGLG